VPHDRAYWTNVIHSAALVPPGDPRYAASRIVAGQALLGLQDLADSAGKKDIKDISPGVVGTALVNFGHGASLGLAGDKTYLDLARQANPWTAGISDVAGTAALAGTLGPLVEGLSPVAQGITLGGGLGAARGGIEPLPGMTRLQSALLMGTGGALTGAVLGKFTQKFVPTVRTIVGNITKMFGSAATPEEIAVASENAIRLSLRRLKVSPEAIDASVASWKANGEIPSPPPKPIAVRPGETITPTQAIEPHPFPPAKTPTPRPPFLDVSPGATAAGVSATAVPDIMKLFGIHP